METTTNQEQVGHANGQSFDQYLPHAPLVWQVIAHAKERVLQEVSLPRRHKRIAMGRAMENYITEWLIENGRNNLGVVLAYDSQYRALLELLRSVLGEVYELVTGGHVENNIPLEDGCTWIILQGKDAYREALGNPVAFTPNLCKVYNSPNVPVPDALMSIMAGTGVRGWDFFYEWRSASSRSSHGGARPDDFAFWDAQRVAAVFPNIWSPEQRKARCDENVAAYRERSDAHEAA